MKPFLEKLITSLLVLFLLAGCGANLRTSDEVEKKSSDVLIQTNKEQNQTLEDSSSDSTEIDFTLLPEYEALTTEIPEGFCLSLAEKSAQLMIEIEKELAYGDGNEGKVFQQLILSSEKLVSWVSARVPFVVANEIFELVLFYQDLAETLASTEFENATDARLQALLFSSLLSEDSVSLDSFLDASNQLGKYVEDSCGPGYPLLTTFSVLVSSRQTNEVEKSQTIIKSFLDIWPKEEIENIDEN